MNPNTTALDTLFDHLKPRFLINDSGDLLPARPVSYDYILAGNGLFKRAANDHLEAMILIQSFRIPILHFSEVYIHPTSLFPGHLLGAIHEDAAFYAERNQERMYFLHIDPEEEKHGRTRAWVSMPAQENQTQKVDYRPPTHSAQTIVCDLHSHHTMRAFFSGTDNADERGFGFYAVVGSLLQSRPELRLRLGMYGDFVDVPADTLFEGGLGLFVDAYSRPPEWVRGDPGAMTDSDLADADLPAGDEAAEEWFSSLGVPDDLWGKINDLCLTENEMPEVVMARLIEQAWEKEYLTPEVE